MPWDTRQFAIRNQESFSLSLDLHPSHRLSVRLSFRLLLHLRPRPSQTGFLSRLGQLVNVGAAGDDLRGDEDVLVLVEQLVRATDGGVTNSNNVGDIFG